MKKNELKTCCIVDLDNTVAERSLDRHFYDWDKVIKDTPIQPVVDLVKAWKNADPNRCIIVLTGRSEGYKRKGQPDTDMSGRRETEKWVKEVLGETELVLMRPVSRIYEKSTIIKEDLYLDNVHDKYNVAFALDDDDNVNEMYRYYDIITLTVNSTINYEYM